MALIDIVKKGSTDRSVTVYCFDNTTGLPKADLIHTSPGIDLWYRRSGAVKTSITEATLATLAVAHSDGGFLAIADGEYRLDLPDAAVGASAGVHYVDIGGTFTGYVVTGGRIRLVDIDLEDTVRAGLTALPNAVVNAAGGLPTSAAGTLAMDKIGYLPAVTAGAAGGVFIAGTNAATTITTALTTTFTGNVTGSVGSVTTVSDKTGYRLSATGVDDVWDEATSGHTAVGSYGQAFAPVASGTATAGGATTITLAVGSSATNSFYNGDMVYLTGGTGAGQGRFVTGYVGGTRVATVGTWAVNPDATSVYVIIPFDTIVGASAPTAGQVADAVWDETRTDHVSAGSFGQVGQTFHNGVTQAGSTTSSIVLAAGASATTDKYKYAVVVNTTTGESRQITAYNGSTKTATIDPAWTTTPSTSDVYYVRELGIDAASLSQIADSVWDEARAGHVTAGSFGEYVLADSVRMSGSTTASDALESIVTGGGGTLTANLAGTVTTVTTLTGHTAQTGDAFARLGAPAGASHAADVAAVKVDTGAMAPKLGTPAGASISADIAAVKVQTAAIEVDTADIQTRIPNALVSGSIKANITHINGAAVTGDGDATPWDAL